MFPADRAHEPLKLLGVDWFHWGQWTGLLLVQHRPQQSLPSLMCGVLITPTDEQGSLGVHTCVLSIHPRSLQQHTLPMHPVPVTPTLPAEIRSPAGSAGREGEWADLQHWHLAAPPAAAAGSPRDWAQHSSGHSTAQDGSGRAGRGPGHPQRAGSEPGRRQSWENSGSMTGSRGEGGKGERWESTWLRSALRAVQAVQDRSPHP